MQTRGKLCNIGCSGSDIGKVKKKEFPTTVNSNKKKKNWKERSDETKEAISILPGKKTSGVETPNEAAYHGPVETSQLL